MGLLELDEDLRRAHPSASPQTEYDKAGAAYDTTMSRAKEIGEEGAGPLMYAIAKTRQAKRTSMGSIELTPEQQSQASKKRFYGFLYGMQKGGLGGALLGMGEVPRAYEDRAKYENYLDKRLKDPSLTVEQKDALHARRYAGEKYSGTSRPWWSSTGRGTTSTQWMPMKDRPGYEQAYSRHSGTGAMEPLIIEGHQPERKRYKDPTDATGERMRAKSRREWLPTMEWWDKLTPEQRRKLFKASTDRMQRWRIDEAEWQMFERLREGYDGMSDEDQQALLVRIRASAFEEKPKGKVTTPLPSDELDAGIRAIDESLAGQAGG